MSKSAVHLQQPTRHNLVESASHEMRVGHEGADPGETLEEVNEDVSIQLAEDCSHAAAEPPSRLRARTSPPADR